MGRARVTQAAKEDEEGALSAICDWLCSSAKSSVFCLQALVLSEVG